jgi:hypothetical protein
MKEQDTVNAKKQITLAVVLEINIMNIRTAIGPTAKAPHLTGANSLVWTRRYHVRIMSAMGSSILEAFMNLVEF